MSSLRKKLGIVILCLLAALFLLVGITLINIYRYSAIDNRTKSDAIIVLGAAEYAGRPSPVFQARLDHALELYNGGDAKFIITTGGSQPGEKTSEGAAGKKYLVKKGVPEVSILVDENSDTTKQNLARAKDLADVQSLTSFILVSDPFHMYRSKVVAQDLGMSVVTSPTRTSPISQNFWLNTEYVARETLLSLLHIVFDA